METKLYFCPLALFHKPLGCNLILQHIRLPSPHRSIHDASAVGADGVGDVTYVDGVQVLVVARLLYEDLRESNFGFNNYIYHRVYIYVLFITIK